MEKRHGWGNINLSSRQEWNKWVTDNQIDYRCHPMFRRNICLRAYDETGRVVTAEQLINKYHQGISYIHRLLQNRVEDRVQDWQLIKYNIKTPMLWRSLCEERGLMNYDIHEMRDWRLAGYPTYNQWRNILHAYGRYVSRHRTAGITYESKRKGVYAGTELQRDFDRRQKYQREYCRDRFRKNKEHNEYGINYQRYQERDAGNQYRRRRRSDNYNQRSPYNRNNDDDDDYYYRNRYQRNDNYYYNTRERSNYYYDTRPERNNEYQHRDSRRNDSRYQPSPNRSDSRRNDSRYQPTPNNRAQDNNTYTTGRRRTTEDDNNRSPPPPNTITRIND